MAALSTGDGRRDMQLPRRGWSLVALFALMIGVVAHCVGAVTEEEAAAAQEWRLDNEQFDWGQSEPNSSVRVAGKGVADVDGNFYFAGVKSYLNETVDDQNLFIARLNADNSIQWTREVRETPSR